MLVSIIIVEDNKSLQQLLNNIINDNESFFCAGICNSAEEALELIPEILPDVVLMDIGLPGMNGIECVKKLKPLCPGVDFMMCTIYDEDEKVFEALEAGANAYILKSTGAEEMHAAIADLVNGGSPMSSDIARKVVQSFQRRTDVKKDYGITAREEEILGLLSKGLIYKEVADRLSISVKTMKKHIYNIYEKMHVHSKVEAVNKFLGNK